MQYVFVNLKRFDVPRSLGGVCPSERSDEWIREVISHCAASGLGQLSDCEVSLLLPESLLLPAVRHRESLPLDSVRGLTIGCQGVFRENISVGGNFGAFTTNLPAAAAQSIGCRWAIIGHSEERRDKLDLLRRLNSAELPAAQKAVNQVINEEVLRALESDLDVLLCVGETADERGEGGFHAQRPRIEAVLEAQLSDCLADTAGHLNDRRIVIGYEPVWAIGPGKTPPDADYIAFVAGYIKDVLAAQFSQEFPVVYGGGLKSENAASIGGIATVEGGLVALTRFSGDIGFEPEGLRDIVARFRQGRSV